MGSVGPDDRLADALERVAHGATVSVPSSLVSRALVLTLTAVLTNGFTAGSYGLFVLARRLQRYLGQLVLGFRRGLSRYLPNAASAAERDAIATFAAALLLAVAGCVGAGLFVAAPAVATVAGKDPRFELFLRIFAVGLPVTVWLYTVAELLRALEAVGPFNLTVRLGLPAAQLLAVLVGTLFVGDLAWVAGGVVVATGAVGVVAAGWLVRSRGLRPRVRVPGGRAIRRRYLRFTLPLFLEGFATQTQRLGYYPVIAVLLSGTAGGVFVVGVLLAGLVRLPLMGVNQFISPVAASLYEDGHHESLRRLYEVTSRLALVGVVGLAVPLAIYRRQVMAVFGPKFADHAPLLPLFMLAMVAAAAAGSVGFLLSMTDNQRALLAVNVAVTVVLIAIVFPLTGAYGLAGLVVTYLVMVTLNNALEVAVLYRLEGLQPLTRRHVEPVVAAVPLAAVALAVRAALPAASAPVVGSALGLVAYGATLRAFGVSAVERRLGTALYSRYRSALGTAAGP